MPRDIQERDLPQELRQKFRVENNTLSRDVKENPKDRIQVEIGDSKQKDFKPQAKIMRWDNDVNFSLRAEEHPDAVVETEGKVIKYKTPDYEVHQYELDPGDIGEDGGLEFEWVLPQKPSTNVLSATIQTKGLNFYYQPALTQEEIDQGAERPEKVVGSYAVYHATKGGMNRAGGMEYKTGKAFHIYRPKVTDKKGEETWADLNIDEENGLLSVTVPQEFLDNAVYPVVVDPTFGYTSAGASNAGLGAGQIRGSSYTNTESGSVTKLSFYSRKVTNNDNAVTALYESTSKDLVSPTGSAVTVNNTTAQWWDSSVSSASITAQDYFLVILGQGTSNGLRWYYDTGGAADSHVLVFETYPTFPDPLSGITYSTLILSIYATYTAKISTLTDNFNDNSINATLWNDDNCSETGGQMVVTANTSTGTYNGISSDSRYDLTESSAFIQLVNAGDTSLSFTTYILELYNDTVDLYWAIEYGATDEIVAYKSPDSVNYTEKYRATYSSTDHKWFRIREASGTVYWDTSADGSSWTNRASDATGYTLTSLNAFFGVENPASGSTTVTFDNFNHLAASVTADLVTTTLSLPTPTVDAESGSTNEEVLPDPITSTISLPAPAISGSASKTADLVTSTISIPAPTISGSASKAADLVTTTLSLQSPTITGQASVISDLTTTTISTLAPTINAVKNVSTTPDPITLTASLPTPSVATAGDVNTSPSPITTTLNLPTFTVSGDASKAADLLTNTLSLLAPTITTTSNATISADVVTPTTSLPAPTISGTAVVTADLVNLTMSLPTPAYKVDEGITADVVTATLSLLAPTVTGSANVTADLVNLTASLPSASLSVDSGYSGNSSWGIDINTFGLVMTKSAKIPTWTTASRPTGRKGLFGFNKQRNCIEIYNPLTSTWSEFNPTPTITVSDTEPSNPETGDLWVDTS